MTCRDCIHYNICSLWTTVDLDEDEAYKFCFGHFKSTDDVAEVKHGHWIHSTTEVGVEIYHRWQCSLCGRTVARLHEEDVEDLPYCHCGAKMDEI